LNSFEKSPPLREVIFEIRWGRVDDGSEAGVRINFEEEELTLFAGLFRSKVQDHFPVYKKVNESTPAFLPHIVKHQFWKATNKWPVVQIGIGIMTVNMNHEGYVWQSFHDSCLEAMKILDSAHHLGLKGLQPIGVELRYLDAFELKENETDSSFVSDSIQIEFGMPQEFLQSPLLEPTVKDHHISFTVPSRKPVGLLISTLDRGLVEAAAAFVQTTIFRSVDAFCPSIDLDSISVWLNDAHKVQQHAYKTLIKPTNERS